MAEGTLKWSADARVRAARYRALRRGTKEMDLLLSRYASNMLAQTPTHADELESLEGFCEILDRPDPELEAIVLNASGEIPPWYNARMRAVVAVLRGFVH